MSIRDIPKQLILIPAAALALLLIVFLWTSDYTKSVKTGGELEAKYLSYGTYKPVRYKDETCIIYYPEEIEETTERLPAVIAVTGTGDSNRRLKKLYQHLSSWGFIVIGVSTKTFEDPVQEALNRIRALNLDESGVLYKRIDTTHLGFLGRSEGAQNALKALSDKGEYKALVINSPSGADMEGVNVYVPTLLVSGKEEDNIEEIYKELLGDKKLMVKKGMSKKKMLYEADGYVTAWFMAYLQNDEGAKEAFFGEEAEFILNTLYEDQK